MGIPMEMVISAYGASLTEIKQGLMYFDAFSVGGIGKPYW
jgi:hypothetical protein